MAFVTEVRESRQYDGTNGAALAGWLDGTYEVASDDGTRLVLRDGEGTRKRIPLGGWLVRDGDKSLLWYGNENQYARRWVVLPTVVETAVSASTTQGK